MLICDSWGKHNALLRPLPQRLEKHCQHTRNRSLQIMRSCCSETFATPPLCSPSRRLQHRLHREHSRPVRVLAADWRAAAVRRRRHLPRRDAVQLRGRVRGPACGGARRSNDLWRRLLGDRPQAPAGPRRRTAQRLGAMHLQQGRRRLVADAGQLHRQRHPQRASPLRAALVRLWFTLQNPKHPSGADFPCSMLCCCLRSEGSSHLPYGCAIHSVG